jgi:hypothetical protein
MILQIGMQRVCYNITLHLALLPRGARHEDILKRHGTKSPRRKNACGGKLKRRRHNLFLGALATWRFK